MPEWFGLGVLAGMGFWPLFAFMAWSLVLVFLIATEHTGFAFLSAVVAAVVAQFAFGYDVFGTIYNDPMVVVQWVIAYVVLGIGYSFVRWFFYCRKWRQDYDAAIDHNQSYYWNLRPQVSTSKSRLTGWMMFWPWSLFWWAFSDLVVEIFEWIYSHVATVYGRIAAYHMAGITPPPEK